jgi:hypothetical protein
MVGVSNKVDSHLKNIENRLKSESFEDILYDIKVGIDNKYQRLYHYGNTSTLLQSIRTSKEKYNLVVRLYNIDREQKPWYVRLFTKKRNFENFEPDFGH